jgi:hypothetical protein
MTRWSGRASIGGVDEFKLLGHQTERLREDFLTRGWQDTGASLAVSSSCEHCANGWTCEEHADRPWPHDDCSSPGQPCACPAGRALVAALDARYRPDAGEG